jgi:tetratricopeptide (TPR) repeat protein
VAEQKDETEPGSSSPSGGDSEGGDERESAEQAEAAEPSVASKPKKKKKRSLEPSDEPIRDRNRRLREQAAGARKRQREEQQRAPARNLDTSEIVDDALARSTQAAGNFLKRHFNAVQWVVVAGLVLLIGYEVYEYRVGKLAEASSDALTVAIKAEDGRIGTEDPGPDPQTALDDPRPGFATAADRRAAAEKDYREVAGSNGTSGAAILAKLGLASVLYDEGKYSDAKAAYESVKQSALASQDVDVKGRSIEGIGMSLESAGQAEAANKAFQELENLDTAGFGALGAYHQARLAFAAGKTADAKMLLEKAQKKLDVATDSSDKSKPFAAPGYLQHAIRELLRAVDPNAVAATPNALTAEQLSQLGAMGDENGGMSQDKLNQLLKEIAKKAKDNPGAPGPAPSPAPPASAP